MYLTCINSQSLMQQPKAGLEMNIIRPLIPLATILFSAMNSMVAADLPEKEAPFTPRILNFRIKVAITLLFLLFGFTSVSIGSEVPEKDSNFAQQVDNLKNNARKEGKIPVIIKLKVPHKPEGMLKPDKVKEQRDNIKKAGDEVSKEIKKVDTKAKITSFDSLPYVATLANENMINALANNPNVVLIYQDSSSEPALDISIPLVNADDAFSLGFSGQGQTVAVIDTGVRLDHEFFNGKIVSQACYSGTSGGTSLCPGGVNSSVALGSGDDCPYAPT